MLKIPRQLRRRLHEFIFSYLPRNYPKSEIALSVLMPLAKKDVLVANFAIKALKENLAHKINRFVIVGQDCDEIRDLAKQNEVEYINENEVLKNYLHIPLVAQKGWIKQQLIKLLAFDFINDDNILVHDSDTIILRPITYFENDTPIYYLADEYTKKYYQFIEKYFGKIERAPRSFVAHAMLLQRQKRAALDAKIQEIHGCSFVEAFFKFADFENYNAFSEYEIYGNYLNHFHKGEFKTRYWYNIKNRKFAYNELSKIREYYKRFNSVSLHIHDT